MKKIFNYKIWRGIAAVFLVLFSIAVFLTSLAFLRDGDINTFLGLTAPRNYEVTDDTNYYPSSFPLDDNKAALNAAIKAHNIRAQEEGSVLIKNENNALPLAADERSVTLFGLASAKPVFKPNGGGPANNGTNFFTALTDAGFSVNPTVNGILSAADATSSVGGAVAEVPVSTYTAAAQSSYASDYNAAAVVVLSRFGGEMAELNPNHADGPQLDLHQNEKDVLLMVKDSGKFGKIVVLINSGFAMDLDWLDDPQYGVDACLQIGFIGGDGANGIANILKGDADPSGSLVDTWAADSLSAPAMRNFGDFTLANGLGLYKNKYVVYAEGIYVGYKYYETRYQDQVLDVNNADGTKGAYASASGWDYAEEMAYPFGYGISYADFTQELESLTWNRETHKVTASVKVTNNGAPAGSAYTGKSKTAVQLYVQLPYASGQAQKSAIQLVDFAKTPLLAKGETYTAEFEADDYIFAVYDQNAVNGADPSKKGCYVFDPGDYYFAVGNDCHDALNNMLAARNVSGLFAHDGTSVAGDAAKTGKVTLAALDNTTHARSKQTDEIVSNQFAGTAEDCDINRFIPNKVTYLSRDDWNTYPDAVTSVTATQEMLTQMDGKTYQKPADAPDINSFVRDAQNGMNFVTMRFVDYDDDETWNQFLDQLSLTDLCNIPGEKMGNDAVLTVNFPAASNGDGPNGLMTGGKLYAGQTVITATLNKELIAQRGDLLAEEAHRLPYGTVYAPGANLHRTQYAGRNGEYYSEDSILSYICGAAQVGAMTKKGFISAVKHFAGNDQESNRHGVATFMTEQTWREGALRGFEGAFTVGGSLGTMTSYNRIGCVPTAASYSTMTQVLRKEWGFKGINMTDSSKDSAPYLFTAESLAAGTNQFNNDAGRSAEIRSELIVANRDGYIYQKLRESAKNFFYAYSRSHIANGLAADSVIEEFVPWWKPALIGINVTLGVILLIGAVLFVLSVYFIQKERQNKTAEVQANESV